MYRRTLLALGMAAPFGFGTAAQADPIDAASKPVGGWPRPSELWDLWPENHMMSPRATLTETIVERGNTGYHDRSLKGISKPRLAVFKPVVPNGETILVIPGGGYSSVGVDREGYEVANTLAERGFLSFVLFYRLPSEGWVNGANVPLADAQRAARLIKGRSNRVGQVPGPLTTIGFSAGGHLCAELATRFDWRLSDPVDDLDSISARPDKTALIYPVIAMVGPSVHLGSRENLLGPNPSEAIARQHSADRNVSNNTPPAFVVHALDDPIVAPENALNYLAALRSSSVPAECHLFMTGGHAFGIRQALSRPVATWLDLFIRWHASL